jgi:hypothetical protein
VRHKPSCAVLNDDQDMGHGDGGNGVVAESKLNLLLVHKGAAIN